MAHQISLATFKSYESRILGVSSNYTRVRIQSHKYIYESTGMKGMDEKWTADDIPDLTGKVIIVTGSNSGIGFKAAKEFARKRAFTILACRNMNKAQAAQDLIQASSPNAHAEIMRLDLANLDSVHEFAREFLERFTRLDVLVNNAGIMMAPSR